MNSLAAKLHVFPLEYEMPTPHASEDLKRTKHLEKSQQLTKVIAVCHYVGKDIKKHIIEQMLNTRTILQSIKNFKDVTK